MEKSLGGGGRVAPPHGSSSNGSQRFPHLYIAEVRGHGTHGFTSILSISSFFESRALSAVSVVRGAVRLRLNIARALQISKLQYAAMTSAEPLRTSSYSPDIGWRVVWQRLSQEHSYKDIARRLQIGVGTAHRIFKRFETTGDVAPLRRCGTPSKRKLDDHHELYIIGLVTENPGITLREICSKIEEATYVQVSGATVCRVLRRNGFTRKKIMQVAKQRTMEFRASFIAHALQFPHNFFVWVDETGSDRRDQVRKFGYALKGLTPVYHRLLARGTRVSSIAVMSSEGVLDFELSAGTTNGDKFFDFIRG